jgi:hypothetical protein
VLSDVAYPGWRVTVDEVEQPLILANYLLSAVYLPPGDHQVAFRYEPGSVRFGMVVSLLSLVLASSAALVLLPRARRAARDESP